MISNQAGLTLWIFVTVARSGIWFSRGLLCVSEYLCLCFVCARTVGEGEGEREAPRADGGFWGEGELDDISRANE